MDFLTPEFFRDMGFPAVVCLYTLFAVNRSQKELAMAINELTSEVRKRGIEEDRRLEKLEDEIKALKFRVEGIQRERN